MFFLKERYYFSILFFYFIVKLIIKLSSNSIKFNNLKIGINLLILLVFKRKKI
jgi:hypothetical protein